MPPTRTRTRPPPPAGVRAARTLGRAPASAALPPARAGVLLLQQPLRLAVHALRGHELRRREANWKQKLMLHTVSDTATASPRSAAAVSGRARSRCARIAASSLGVRKFAGTRASARRSGVVSPCCAHHRYPYGRSRDRDSDDGRSRDELWPGRAHDRRGRLLAGEGDAEGVAELARCLKARGGVLLEYTRQCRRHSGWRIGARRRCGRRRFRQMRRHRRDRGGANERWTGGEKLVPHHGQRVDVRPAMAARRSPSPKGANRGRGLRH